MIFGDLAFYGGIVGIILYICVIVIGHTTRISKLVDVVRKYDDRIAALSSRKQELTAIHHDKQPQVDALLKRVLELREMRDRLQIQLEDMQASVSERKIEIKSARS